MTTLNQNPVAQRTLAAPSVGPNFARLGGQLGVILCLLGFLVLFLGWNGAAGKNVIMAQFPFLISGGIAGLAIVVVGAALLIVQNAREDRARLEATLERLIAAVEAGGSGAPRSAPAGMGGMGAGMGAGFGGGMMMLAGTTSYHRVDCSLAEAREEAHIVGLEEVLTRGLAPCRVCKPPALAGA
jgi:hypothetical protein